MAVDHKLKFAVGLQAESPSETDGLLLHDPDKITSFTPSCRTPRYQARRVKSKGAVLVIVWILLTMLTRTSVIVEVISKPLGGFTFEIVVGVVMAVLYVFAGWLADVYFGRYKVMKGSIWIMWLGSVGGTLLLMIHLLNSLHMMYSS